MKEENEKQTWETPELVDLNVETETGKYYATRETTVGTIPGGPAAS